MGKTYVKNGTPVGTSSLCDTCCYAHIVSGYRETECIVVCTYDRSMLIPFKVRDCTNHLDKNRPTWKQMEDLALPILESTTSKPAGFVTLPTSEDNDN